MPDDLPNLAYMTVNGFYLAALAVWLGGMVAFAAVFVPSLTGALERPQVARVIAAFLPRFRRAVGICAAVLLAASGLKFALWETYTPWLLARWLTLAAMVALAGYDFRVLAPRLAAARAAGDRAGFERLHGTAVGTLGATSLLGLVAYCLS